MRQSLITSAQAAVLLDVSQRTVVRLAARGELEYVQRTEGHGEYLFAPDAVLKLRARRRIKPVREAS